MVVCHLNAGQCYSLMTANEAKFTYLETTVTNPESIQDYIKEQIKFGYRSVQDPLSTRIFCKNIKK
jgi:hypothetical protein